MKDIFHVVSDKLDKLTLKELNETRILNFYCNCDYNILYLKLDPRETSGGICYVDNENRADIIFPLFRISPILFECNIYQKLVSSNYGILLLDEKRKEIKIPFVCLFSLKRDVNY